MTASPSPFLSIVITARHDNYGGDFRDRIAAPLRFNYEKLTERGVPYEVVLVEWNPIEGRPLLCEMLVKELPEIAGGVLRTIVVAPQYQSALTQNPRVPYLEDMAKNVGIRRAAGPSYSSPTRTSCWVGRSWMRSLVASYSRRRCTAHRDTTSSSASIRAVCDGRRSKTWQTRFADRTSSRRSWRAPPGTSC